MSAIIYQCFLNLHDYTFKQSFYSVFVNISIFGRMVSLTYDYVTTFIKFLNKDMFVLPQIC